MNSLDTAVFRAVNGWPESTAPFWVFLSNATKTTGGLVLIGSLVVLSLVWKPTRLGTVLALLAWPLANLTTDVLKDAFQWNRPSWPDVMAANPWIQVRVEPLTSFGTASAHSANMMAVATVFLWLHRPMGALWCGVAVLTGLSRIYVGVHWPSEVVLGWLCGAVCGTIIVKCHQEAARLLARRRTSPEQGPEAAE
ncbi:MAG: phosphatase PAP2 family protein [Armatimonadetes bacterium]|nr:phosphatase PAP2 family protein [Armatimonadota bacterium]